MFVAEVIEHIQTRTKSLKLEVKKHSR